MAQEDNKEFGLTEEEFEQLEYERNEIIAKNILQDGDGGQKQKLKDTKEKEKKAMAKAKRDPIVKAITEDVLNRFRFLTIEESREVLFYDDGVYTQGGEVIIEKTAESLYGYKLANRYLAEIKGHIMRRTYHKRKELDFDINIVNLKNGLYNIETGGAYA